MFSSSVNLTSIQKVLGSIPGWLIFFRHIIPTCLSRLQEVVRTSDVRVSERTPLNQLRLKPSGPIYNELTGEVEILFKRGGVGEMFIFYFFNPESWGNHSLPRVHGWKLWSH